MKLNILTKLQLPTALVVLVVMAGSALFTASLVTSQMEEQFYGELKAVNNAVAKNVSTAYLSFQTDMATVSVDPSIIALLKALAAGQKADDVAKKVTEALAYYKKTFVQYRDLGVIMPTGVIPASTSPGAVGASAAQRAYFQQAMQGKYTTSEPLHSLDNNLKTMVIGSPVRDEGGKVIGIVYADMDCRTLGENTIGDIKIGSTGYPFLVDARGLMMAHPNLDLVQKFDARTSDWGRQVMGKTEGQLTYKTMQGVSRLMHFQLEKSSQWYVISALDATEIAAVTDRLRNISLAITVAGVLLICLVIYSILRPIIRDLLRGVSFASTVAEGNLNEELNIRRADELGTLFEALRNMVANLKKSIASAEEESRNAREQSAKAQEAMRAAEAAGQDAARKTESMQQAAARLGEVVGVVSSASEQLSAQITQSERGASEQASRVAETATAMEEMNATVMEVARSAGDASQATAVTRQKAVTGAQVVQQVVSSIREVQQQSLALKADMGALDQNAQAINQIMGVISDIADQTNLLALNAAIEAARAGEAGRGFAVVADEVRKLAEKTMASTTDVGNAIKAIQVSADKSMSQVDAAVVTIERATALAGQSGEALAEIVDMVDGAADQVRSIATASEQQSSTSEEISRSVTQVNNIATETSRAMQEASQAVNELARQAQTLTRLMEDMRKI